MENYNQQLKEQYKEAIPILLLCSNILAFIYFLASDWFKILEIHDAIHIFNKHIYEAGLIPIIFLYLCSSEWNKWSRNAVYVLFALWVNNTPYIMGLVDVDLYFVSSSLLIYLMSLYIITKYVLIKR